jgi:hypothetical protein
MPALTYFPQSKRSAFLTKAYLSCSEIRPFLISILIHDPAPGIRPIFVDVGIPVRYFRLPRYEEKTFPVHSAWSG